MNSPKRFPVKFCTWINTVGEEEKDHLSSDSVLKFTCSIAHPA